MNTGPSQGTAIIPVMLGNSLHSLQASRMMRERGISVQPILHPAVAEEGARLRFFLSALHTEEQIATTVESLAEVLRQLDPCYLQHRQ
jgi:8-amino-7-oxononanoate synthase